MSRNGPRPRRILLHAALALCGWLAVAPASAGPAVEATAAALQRIEAWNEQLLAVIATDPTAMAQAAELDRERAEGRLRGPLHGVPVLIKDNIETRDQATTAGSLALAANYSGRDAPLVARLRAAGLVMVGKANLSEWANFRSERSSSGWSAVGGQARNPHAPARSPCGSSSGSAVAVAAGMVSLAVGTETDGSIVCPAAVNGIVGIKPTVGLVSRRGIVPISHSQDTAGPMANNVRDATYLLMAMTGRDPADPASPQEPGRFGRDYAAALKPEGLRGKRIGVVRSLAGFHEGVDARFEQAIADLRSAGADIVDQLAFPEEPAGLADAAYEVLLHEFKHDLNEYLAGLPGAAGALRLPDLIEFNLRHAEAELKWFQQEIFLQAQARGDLQSPAYLDALALTRDYSRGGIDGLLQAHALDLLVSPTDAPAWVIDLVMGDRFLGGSSSMPARAGYPHITVPMGYVHGLPVGLSFYGTAFAEEVLIEAAYAYEQSTGHASPPRDFGRWQAAVAPE